MAQLLAHPTEGEAVRLTIPERQFWARIEQASCPLTYHLQNLNYPLIPTCHDLESFLNA